MRRYPSNYDAGGAEHLRGGAIGRAGRRAEMAFAPAAFGLCRSRLGFECPSYFFPARI